MTKTAYDDPATRWAVRRTVLFRLGCFLFAIVLHIAWLYVYVVFLTPVWLWVMFPILLIFLYVAMVAFGLLLGVRGLRRVLKIYPWQQLQGATTTAKNGTTRFRIPNPDQRDKQVSCNHGDWLGSSFTYWVRAVKSGAVQDVWFAGDPRYIGVVAVPGPRKLIPVAQPEAINRRMSARKRGVSPESRERARAAGARVG